MQNIAKRTKSDCVTRMLFILCIIYCYAAESQTMTDEQAISRLPSVEMITAQIKNNPNFAQLYIMRAVRYKAAKQYALSIADWTKAMTLNYKPEGSHDKGQGLYSMRATTYMEMKNFSAALADLNKAMKIAPGDTVTRQYRAICYMQMKIRTPL